MQASSPLRSLSLAFATAAASMGLSGAATAQTVLTALEGEFDGDRMGAIFDVVADFDGDGFPELIVGFPGDDQAGVEAGRAELRSSATGAVLRTHYGPGPGARFGTSVSDAGDVDADGTLDYVVGSTVAHFGIGAAWVYSGANGTLLHFLRGTVVGSEFSKSLDAVGDLDGDGHGDLAVGAPGDNRVHVVSGSDGSPLFVWTSSIDPVGSRVRGMGDFDGDGTPDVLLGDARDLGAVMVHSGANGSLLHLTWGWSDGCAHGTDGFIGFASSPAGDLDGDGLADFLAGVQYGCPHGSDGRRIQINSGFPFVAQAAPPGSWEVPLSGPYPDARSVGDIDGDGTPDQAYWTPPVSGNASIGLRSGATGAPLATLTSPSVSPERFGAEVVCLGDVDGDGADEFAVGAPGAHGDGTERGQIYIFDWTPCGSIARSCSPATPNESGAAARLDYEGSTSVAIDEGTFTVTGLGEGHSGLIIASPDLDERPLGNGTICVGDRTLGFIVRLGTGIPEGGVMQVDLNIAHPPLEEARILPGSTWNFQAWNRDFAASGAGFNFSDALSITFCP